MKTLKLAFFFFFLMFFAAIGESFAQNNLQWNRAVVQTYNHTWTSPNPANFSTTLTIPANKVWKIENFFSYNSTTKVSNISSPMNTMLAGNIPMQSSSSINPIWLPAGTHTILVPACSGCSFTNFSATYIINAIEFNIVP